MVSLIRDRNGNGHRGVEIESENNQGCDILIMKMIHTARRLRIKMGACTSWFKLNSDNVNKREYVLVFFFFFFLLLSWGQIAEPPPPKTNRKIELLE